MSDFLRKLTRKNVYGSAILVATVLVLLYAFFESWRDVIYILFFNPIWPIILGWLEFILQENEKEIAAENQKKLNSLSGVIRRSVDKASDSEQVLIEAIIDAVGVDDLIALSKAKIAEKKIQEKIAETKVEQKKPENLTP